MAKKKRGDVLKGLGVKRRRGKKKAKDPPPEDDSSDEGDEDSGEDEGPAEDSGAEDSGAEDSSAEDAAPAQSEPAPSKPAPSKPKSSSGPGLGIKRRRGAKAEPPPPEEPAAEDAPAATGPATTSLGSDETSQVLAGYFRVRPAIREQLPPQVFGLKRTHGRYIGDGRPERTLQVGFKPGLVVYTIPPYLEGEIPQVEKDGTLIEPPLHRQPTFTETGFTVGEAFNKAGDWYMYVVFQSDEPIPLAPRAEESQQRGRSRRGGSGGKPSKDAVGKSLGIKRRR